MHILWWLNIIICFYGLTKAFSEKSILVIFWLYSFYVGIIGYFKYSINIIDIRVDKFDVDYWYLLFYVTANLLFLLGWVGAKKLLTFNGAFNFSEYKNAMYARFYLASYVAGCVLYFGVAINYSYNEFVGYEGSAWGQVLFYGGASLIVYLIMEGRNIIAAFAATPYVLLSMATGVRSFLALSIFPILLMFLFGLNGNKSKNKIIVRYYKYIIIAIVLILSVVFLRMASFVKHGEAIFEFPEEKLIEYYFMVVGGLDTGKVGFGFESVERFFWGFLSFGLKYIGIRYNKEDDPQAFFVKYIDDYSEEFGIFYHYPALWQADIFAAFGYAGLLLAIFWGGIFYVLEMLLKMRAVIWIFMLPVSSWVIFMFVRGAVGNSTISISYLFLYHFMCFYVIEYFYRKISK